MSILITTLKPEELDRLKPLWEKLNAQHLAGSAHFKRHFTTQTFKTRSAKWRAMPGDGVHIGAAVDDSDRIAGYCVCSLQDGMGELDSIYIEPEYRGQELGHRLAAAGVEWMKERGCRHIDVMVAEGNEAVFPFYEKLGFRVRGTVLRMPEQEDD